MVSISQCCQNHFTCRAELVQCAVEKVGEQMSCTSGGLGNAICRACEEELHLLQQPLHCVFSVQSNVLVAFPGVVLHLEPPTDSWNGFMVYLENIY